MTLRLQGRVAMVTGAAGGIGTAVAQAFFSEGARVILTDLDVEACGRVGRASQKKAEDWMAVRCDVSREDGVGDLFRKIREKFGRLDILVNNAGIIYEGSIQEMDEEEWDRIFRVNLKSVFLCSREAIGLMKKQRSGRIINLGSVSGKTGGVNTAAYAASKAGVNCFTFSLAKELAPFGIRVNAVAPGFIQTAMTGKLPEEKRMALIQAIPLGRPGEPKDVARAIVFLASEESNFITGEILDVNGGFFMD